MDRRRQSRHGQNSSSSKTKSQHQQYLFDITSLPTEILIEILIRLPSKTIAQFKTVSRSWLSILTSPSFLRQHCDFVKSSYHHRHTKFTYAHKRSRFYGCFTVGAFMLRDKQVIELEWDNMFSHSCIVEPVEGEFIEVSGPIDGIFCIIRTRRPATIFKISSFALWNPTNSHVKVLPIVPHPTDSIGDLESGFVFQTRIADYGFGYDSSSNDYKVVILISCYEKSSNLYLLGGFQVYSHATNEWRQLDPLKVSIKGVGRHIRDCNGGFYLNGACHWSNNCFDCGECEGKCIISFHFKDEVFRVYNMPNDVGDIIQVTRMNGCLAVVCVKEKYVFNIWTMKEYGVESTWFNVYNIRIKEKSIISIFLVDEEVFIQASDGKLICYPIQNPSEKYKYGFTRYLRHVLPYHESLIPLE